MQPDLTKIPSINLVSLASLKMSLGMGLKGEKYQPTQEQILKYKKIEGMYEKSKDIMKETKEHSQKQAQWLPMKHMDVLSGGELVALKKDDTNTYSTEPSINHIT